MFVAGSQITGTMPKTAVDVYSQKCVLSTQVLHVFFHRWDWGISHGWNRDALYACMRVWQCIGICVCVCRVCMHVYAYAYVHAHLNSHVTCACVYACMHMRRCIPVSSIMPYLYANNYTVCLVHAQIQYVGRVRESFRVCEQDAGRQSGQACGDACTFGWHYLSKPTCLMRLHLFYALFVVPRITILC